MVGLKRGSGGDDGGGSISVRGAIWLVVVVSNVEAQIDSGNFYKTSTHADVNNTKYRRHPPRFLLITPSSYHRSNHMIFPHGDSRFPGVSSNR